MHHRLLKINQNLLLAIPISVALFIWVIASLVQPSHMSLDAGLHTEIAIQFSRNITNFKGLHELITLSNYYPPLVHILVGVAVIFAGLPSIQLISQVIVLGFWILAAVMTFNLTKYFTRNKFISCLVATAYVLLPINIYLSKQLLLEIPLAAMILTFCWLFLQRDKLRYAPIWLGIVLGFALLIKWTAVCFLVPLVIFPLLFNKDRIKLLKTCIVFTVIAFCISAPWYINNLDSLLNTTKGTINAGEKDPKGLANPYVWSYYLEITASSDYLGNLNALVVLLVILLPVLFKKTNKQFWLLVFTVGVSYLIFTIIPNKDNRYMYSSNALILILFGLSLRLLRNQVRARLVKLIIVLFLLSLITHSLIKLADHGNRINWLEYRSKVIATVQELKQQSNLDKISFVPLFNVEEMNAWNLGVTAKINNIDGEVTSTAMADVYIDGDWYLSEDRILRSNYLLLPHTLEEFTTNYAGIRGDELKLEYYTKFYRYIRDKGTVVNTLIWKDQIGFDIDIVSLENITQADLCAVNNCFYWHNWGYEKIMGQLTTIAAQANQNEVLSMLAKEHLSGWTIHYLAKVSDQTRIPEIVKPLELIVNNHALGDFRLNVNRLKSTKYVLISDNNPEDIYDYRVDGWKSFYQKFYFAMAAEVLRPNFRQISQVDLSDGDTIRIYSGDIDIANLCEQFACVSE